MTAPLSVSPQNREPIKRTAMRLGLSVGQTLRHCRSGRLAHVVDAAGRYWSSEAAAIAFMGFHSLSTDAEQAARAIMVETLGVPRTGTTTGTNRSRARQKTIAPVAQPG